MWGNYCGGRCDGSDAGKEPLTGDGGLDQVQPGWLKESAAQPVLPFGMHVRYCAPPSSHLRMCTSTRMFQAALQCLPAGHKHLLSALPTRSPCCAGLL